MPKWHLDFGLLGWSLNARVRHCKLDVETVDIEQDVTPPWNHHYLTCLALPMEAGMNDAIQTEQLSCFCNGKVCFGLPKLGPNAHFFHITSPKHTFPIFVIFSEACQRTKQNK